MRLCLAVVVLIGTLCPALGDDCSTIAGAWTNQHGSEMSLTHDKSGILTGTYTTAVEAANGTDGTRRAHIVGAAPYGSPGATFGFSVMWADGRSTTIWTGQCHICDKEAVLMTSWLLRAKVDTCGDKWKAVQIGQDYFRRKLAPTDQTPENRVGADIVDEAYGRDPDLDPRWGNLPRNLRLVHRRNAPTAAAPCAIPGVWYNDIGSKVDLGHAGKGVLNGEYWTGQEVRAGELSGRHSRVYGQYNPDTHQHTLAYFVVWNKGESITGWVGQCQVCGDNKTEVLETTWFHRVAVTSCHANWKSTLYGQNTFQHTQQRPINPGDDMVGELGEDVGLCPPSASSAPTALPAALPLTALFMTLRLLHTAIY